MAVRYSRLSTDDPELGQIFDFSSAFTYSNPPTARSHATSAFKYSKIGHEMEFGRKDVRCDVVKQTLLSRVCHYIISSLCFLMVVITFPISLWFSFKIVKNYERIVTFRLGQFSGSKGPGMVFVLPCVDKWQKVDLRIRAFSVPPQQLLTADGAIIEVGAEVHFCVTDPMKSIACVVDMNRSLRILVQAMLTNQLVQRNLADIEGEKLQLVGLVQTNANVTGSGWGIEISRIELSSIKVLKNPNSQGMGTSDLVMPPGLLPNLASGGAAPALFQQLASFVGSVVQGGQPQPSLSRPQDIAIAAASGVDYSDAAPEVSTGPTPQEIMAVLQTVLSDSLVKSVDAIYQFEIHGPAGKERYYIDLKNGSGSTGPGIPPSGSADIVLEMSVEDMQSMFLGSLNPLQAYMSGLLQASGDLSVANRLKDVLKRVAGKLKQPTNN